MTRERCWSTGSRRQREGLLVSSPTWKIRQLRSHHCIQRRSKKLKKLKSQQFFLDPSEERSQGKVLPLILETQVS